jgi:hypothetical protein
MDDNPATYWSSTGGAVCCTEDAPGWLLVDLGAARPVAALLLQLTDGQDLVRLHAGACGDPAPEDLAGAARG